MLGKVRKVTFIVLSLGLIGWAVAQTTGKIAGKVKDKATNQALIGLNVAIEGASLGAATDANGWYMILNVPPGSQELVFSYIGYKTVTVKDVLVKIDRTTNINTELEVDISL